ncbi:zinc knuckle [Cooperia oncophora]
MRTDDPRRETVVASVREQVSLVKEIIKATLLEVSELCRPVVAERVFKLLRVAQIGSVSDLQEHLRKDAVISELLVEIGEILQCNESEIGAKLRELTTALKTEQRNSEIFRLQLSQKELQIEQLRHEVECMGQKPSEDQSSGTRPLQGESEVPVRSDHSGNSDQFNPLFQMQSSKISTPSNQKSCGTTLKSGSGNSHETQQSSDTGEVDEFSLSDYIRTMSLPDVQPFSGKPGECFKRFLNSFDMKYPKGQWKELNRLQLFQSFLRKNALTVFETLPSEIRSSTLDRVIDAMKERLRIDGNSQRVKALAGLRTLAIRPGQAVNEFCFVLESLANKAYPDVPAEATSLQKAEILCRQLANWNGSYCLTEALETSSCEQAYEKVKEAALRLERSLKTAEECRIATRARSTHNFNQKHAVGDKQPGPFVGKGTEEIAKIGTDKPRKLPLSNKPETTPPYQQRRRDHGPPRCYKCGKRGHMAKDCSVSSSRQQHSSVLREDPNQTSSVAYASLIDKWMCTIWEESASSVSEWFGQKPLVDIIICGIKATALLDTGSQTTIIPVKLLKRAVEYESNLDEYIEHVPGPKVNVRDASGNVMEVFDTIRVAITLGSQLEFVSVYVGEGSDEVVILGTNALHMFKLKLVRHTSTKSESLYDSGRTTANISTDSSS